MTTSTFRSSGDLTADRRFAYAVELLGEGDALAAADLIVQALERVPDWAAGWFTLGQAWEGAGDAAAAITAFARAAELDRDDGLGASLHLARLGSVPTPDNPPAAYVRGLFDAYADRFDTALVERLDYRAPRLLADALFRVAPGQAFARGLDLGCGTGLMAAELRRVVADLTGVDLSERMVEAARAKHLYTALEVNDIVVAMQARPPGTFDLITAADVFCYLGDLEPVLRAAARVLLPQGRLAFTVENATNPATTHELAESLRFRHGAEHVRLLLGQVGLAIERIDRKSLRKDRDVPIEGLIVIATKISSSAI